jgi:hypothetical protein
MSKSPTISRLPLANPSPIHFVDLVNSLLTSSECINLIREHTSSIIPVSGSYSNRLRHIFTDVSLSELLWTRLAQFYEKTTITDQEGQTWTAHSLNPVFRFCRYEAGDGFGPHFDGRRLVSLDSQSFMTVNIYLNTVPGSAGGATRVLSAPSSPKWDRSETFEVLDAIRPVEGTAAIFRDSLFHDGEVLKEGEKYLLRTDMIFERDVAFDFDGVYKDLSKEERGGKALDLALRFEDGGDMAEAVRWYRKAYKLDPGLEKAG